MANVLKLLSYLKYLPIILEYAEKYGPRIVALIVELIEDLQERKKPISPLLPMPNPQTAKPQSKQIPLSKNPSVEPPKLAAKPEPKPVEAKEQPAQEPSEDLETLLQKLHEIALYGESKS